MFVCIVLVVYLYFLLFFMCSLFCFFFKQKTAYEMRISDWSSDVCSSDLQTDDGKHDSAAISSREAILEEIGTHFHGTLYRKGTRSEEHTSELQSLMRISYAVFCLKKKTIINHLHAHYAEQHHI